MDIPPNENKQQLVGDKPFEQSQSNKGAKDKVEKEESSKSKQLLLDAKKRNKYFYKTVEELNTNDGRIFCI